MAEDRRTEVLEDGDIFFLYRPRTNEHDPSGLEDVQRLFMVLRPRGGKTVRLCVAGRKRLPDVDVHERVWGFVDMVTDDESKIERALREQHYETKTRGEQEQPAARPAGEGLYVISLEDGQMHLSYELELPDSPGDVQETFGIAPTASFVLSVKNPEKGQPKGAGLDPDRKADYPKRLQQEFRGRRFAREDVALLNHEGAEFILVGARTNPEAEYGIGLDVDDEKYETSDVRRRMHMAKTRHPIAPLVKGRWD